MVSFGRRLANSRRTQDTTVLPWFSEWSQPALANKALQQTRRLFGSRAGVVASEQHQSGVGWRRRRAPRS